MNEFVASASVVEAPLNLPTRAKPFYFVSRGQPLFAWFHAPTDATVFDHAVLICPSLGHELVHAYRGMKRLAELLASQGIAVLRFDWFGTGDSAGGDHSSDLIAHWKANIRDAVSLLKSECRFERVSVIGFRLGGLLAVEGLAEHDLANDDSPSVAIENLVLWAPVVNGRAYIRELRLLDSMRNIPSRNAQATVENRPLEAGGFQFSAETIACLSNLDITRQPLKLERALVVQRDDLPSDYKTLKWLEARNVVAEARTLPGVKELLVEPHHTQVPHEAIAAISAWLLERLGDSAMRTFDPYEVGEPAATIPLPTREDRLSSAEVACREVIWRSGGLQDLVGVVSEPLRLDTSLPLIVLLNSGAAYRIGANRLNVLIARRLAQMGFRSLRFDLRGLGDSPAALGARENDAYPNTGFDDLTIVLEMAKREFGHDRCVFLGLCSGAYFAFQAAVQFRDPALVESIMINPLTYFWRAGMTIDDPELRDALESSWRFTRKLDAPRLWKFLSGRSEIGYLGAAQK